MTSSDMAPVSDPETVRLAPVGTQHQITLGAIGATMFQMCW